METQPTPGEREAAQTLYSFQILGVMGGPRKGQFEWIVFERATRHFAQGGYAPSFAAAFRDANRARIELLRQTVRAGARWV
jgi:hypothetical protein